MTQDVVAVKNLMIIYNPSFLVLLDIPLLFVSFSILRLKKNGRLEDLAEMQSGVG